MKKIFSLFAAVLMAGSLMAGVKSDVIKWDAAVAGADLAASYASPTNADFVFNQVGGGSIDGNNTKFGTADKYDQYAFRFKAGGATNGSTRTFSLSIPEAGTLKVAARTASSSNENRILTLKQGETTLVAAGLPNDQTVVSATDGKGSVFSYVVVEVEAGTVNVEVSGGINFYAFILETETVPMRVYCKMEHSWWKADGAAVGIHYWGGEGATNWPGVRMNPVEGVADTWYFDVDTTQNHNVIFTRVNGSGEIADWGAKTTNLTIPTDGKNLYTITSATATWGDPGCTGEWSVYTTPEPKPTYNYYLAGTMTTPAWSSVPMDGDSIVLPLEAGEHGFKVQLAEGSWVSALSYDNVNAECSSEGYYTNSDRNVCFTLAEAGQVKVKVVDGQICVTGAFTEPEPEPTYNYYLAGTMTTPAWSSAPMDGDSIVLSLEAGEHQFRVQREAGKWENAMGFSAVNAECSSEGLSAGEFDNVVFTLVEAGQVKLKIVEDQICVTGAFYVEPEPVVVKDTAMYVAGNFTNWAAGMQALPYAITLPVDSALEFKQVRVITTTTTVGEEAPVVTKDTTWYGQANEGAYMTRENIGSGWMLDGGANVLLTTDATGEYIFSLTEAGEFLVTFPEIATAVEDLRVQPAGATKLLRNGQVIIIRDGIRYNAVGAKL